MITRLFLTSFKLRALPYSIACLACSLPHKRQLNKFMRRIPYETASDSLDHAWNRTFRAGLVVDPRCLSSRWFDGAHCRLPLYPGRAGGADRRLAAGSTSCTLRKIAGKAVLGWTPNAAAVSGTVSPRARSSCARGLGFRHWSKNGPKPCATNPVNPRGGCN